MLACEDVVIVEMSVPTDGLAIFGVRHHHVTAHNLVVLLGKTYDNVV